MEERYTVKQFLLDDKNGIMPDYFKYKFYKNLKAICLGYKEGKFDAFLDELYMKNTSEYFKWYKSFAKVSYSFLQKYPNILTEIVKNNSIEDMLIANDMYKYSMQLVSKCVPMWATVTTVTKTKKELIAAIYLQFELLESELEDNILRKTQEEFYKRYGEYNNSNLSELYNAILDNFEDDIRNVLLKQLEKFNMIYDKCVDIQRTNMTTDLITAAKKRKNNIKTYGKY